MGQGRTPPLGSVRCILGRFAFSLKHAVAVGYSSLLAQWLEPAWAEGDERRAARGKNGGKNVMGGG